jgi:peptidoglycan-associated lipoprotein
MRLYLPLLGTAALLVAGCGANKEYVAQKISESESRTNSQITSLKDKTDGNATEIERLRSLSTELSRKTDMAVNQAKGFETFQVLWSGEINFDFDSDEITPTAELTLNEAGDKLEKYPGSVVEICGHTDRTGTPKYNLMLGERRANAAKRFLSDKFGISLYRMFIISYGRTKPVSLPDERNASAKNRRVTLKIWGNP